MCVQGLDGVETTTSFVKPKPYSSQLGECKSKCRPAPAKKMVCCRITLNGGYVSVVQTASACVCRCYNSRVLFTGECRKPPTYVKNCTGEPIKHTCCYLQKWDLTFTTSNECMCLKSGGRVVNSAVRGLSTM